MRKRGAKLLKIIGTLLLLWLLLEVGFGLHYLWRGEGALWVIKPGKGLGHVPLKQGSLSSGEYRVKVSINRQGFVDYEHKVFKSPRLYRIAVLGDSFIEAVQVPRAQNLCAQLEKALQLSHSGSYEVFNFGVAGAGTAQEYEVFNSYVKPYKPDLVILAFYSNDVLNNYYKLEPKKYKPFYLLKAGKLVRLQEGDALIQGNPALALLRNYSYLYRFYQEHREAAIPLELQVYASKSDSNWQEAWQLTEALLKALAREVRESGAHFLVVYLPSRYEIYPDWRQELLSKLYPKAARLAWDWQKPSRLLEQICVKAQLDYLNLTPFYQSYSSTERLYFKKDGHLTALGHLRAAQILKSKVINLLDARQPR
jgi:hypothetical protein